MEFQRTPIRRGKNAGRFMISYYDRNAKKNGCIRADKTAAIAKYGHTIGMSIRLNKVAAAIEWTLRNCTLQSMKAYDLYVDMIKDSVATEQAIATRRLAEARASLKDNQEQYAKYLTLQLDDAKSYKKFHKGKLEQYQGLISAASSVIGKAEAEKTRLASALPTKEQFFELTNSYLLQLLKCSDLVEEDLVYRALVSNLVVGDDSVSVIKLNPPFDLLVDLTKVLYGG
jgi:hypothetical protein